MKTEEVTVQGQKYLLRRMLPTVGSFIYMKMMGALLTSDAPTEEPSEQAKEIKPRDKARMLCALAFMRGLSFDHMQFAQNQAIMTVSRIEDGDAVIPLMTDGGKWVPSPRYTSVDEDPGLVQKLVLESLAFNLESFFSEGSIAQKQ